MKYYYNAKTPENSFEFEIVYKLKDGYIIKAEEKYFKISKKEMSKAKKMEKK